MSDWTPVARLAFAVALFAVYLLAFAVYLTLVPFWIIGRIFHQAGTRLARRARGKRSRGRGSVSLR